MEMWNCRSVGKSRAKEIPASHAFFQCLWDTEEEIFGNKWNCRPGGQDQMMRGYIFGSHQNFVNSGTHGKEWIFSGRIYTLRRSEICKMWCLSTASCGSTSEVHQSSRDFTHSLDNLCFGSFELFPVENQANIL